MLYDGAVLLFSHDQVASGTDLAKLYIDTLNEAESSPEEIHFIRISKLYQLIPCDNIDKPMVLSTGLKWSSKDTNSPVGHPRLQGLQHRAGPVHHPDCPPVSLSQESAGGRHC